MEVKDVRYLASGMWNIVFEFGLRLNRRSDDYQPCIIRFSNAFPDDDEDEDTANEVFERRLAEACEKTFNTAMILQYVSKHLPNTPELLAFNATTNNAIHRPYTIQSRLPGQPLEQLWTDLSLEAKLQITEKIADFILKCEAIEFPLCGDLYGLKTTSTSHDGLGIREIGASQAVSFESCNDKRRTLADKCKRMLPTHIADIDAEGMTEEFVEEQYGALRDVGNVLTQVANNPELKHHVSANINDAHLKHCDLHQGNIMVHSTIDKENKETYLVGIIDWDDAQSWPKILSRGPPTFLWQNEAVQPIDEKYWYWDGDADLTPRSIRDYWDEPHGSEIKAHFDRYVLEKLTCEQGTDAPDEWLEDTYGDATFVRRVASLALWGVQGGRVGAVKELVEEWAEKMDAKPETIDSAPDDSSPTAAPTSPASFTSDLSTSSDNCVNSAVAPEQQATAASSPPTETPVPAFSVSRVTTASSLPELVSPTVSNLSHISSFDYFAEIYSPKLRAMNTLAPSLHEQDDIESGFVKKTPPQLEEGVSNEASSNDATFSDKTPLQLEDGISSEMLSAEAAPYTLFAKLGKIVGDAVSTWWSWLNEERRF